MIYYEGTKKRLLYNTTREMVWVAGEDDRAKIIRLIELLTIEQFQQLKDYLHNVINIE